MKTHRMLSKPLTLLAFLFLGLSYTTNASSVSYTTTIYYVGPNDAADQNDNPLNGGSPIFGPGGDSITAFNGYVTSSGATETISFNTAVNPAISVGTAGSSSPTSPFDVQLYGVPNTMISGGVLQTGTYTFNSSCSDYFGIYVGSPGITAPSCNNSIVTCNADEICNAGTSPSGSVMINVAANGVVTIADGSLEVGFSTLSPTPELSTLLLFGTGLLALAFVLRKHKGSQV
jgi:hypothetical protein